MSAPPVRIGLVGFGRWGRNHARTLDSLGLLAGICDADAEARAAASQAYPAVPVVERPEELIRLLPPLPPGSPAGGEPSAERQSPGCRALGLQWEGNGVRSSRLPPGGGGQGGGALPGTAAVVLASSATTHAALARAFLDAGIHVLVEKPLALTVEEGKVLVALAQERHLVLQVGHILEYHPARAEISTVLASGELGDLLCARMVRTSLGTIRDVEDVLFSFAPHDIAFALSLAGREPETVTASGFDLFARGIADTAVIVLEFPERFSVTIHVSWLEPRKEHRSILVGTKGMLEWSDTGAEKLVRVYGCLVEGGRGANPATPSSPLASLGVLPRGGGRRDGEAGTADPARAPVAPAIRLVATREVPVPAGEPLRLELLDFADCIRTGRTPRASGAQGLSVLAVLQAAEESMREGRTVRTR